MSRAGDVHFPYGGRYPRLHTAGVELLSFPGPCHHRKQKGQRDRSSLWPIPFLPLIQTSPHLFEGSTRQVVARVLERLGGIEPPSSAWKAGVEPFNYKRISG